MAVKRISPVEAKALVDAGYTYLDVRTTGEYEQGHPTGAHNAPVMNAGAGGMAPNPDFLSVMLAAYPKDARLVVGCRSGARSQRAAMMLEAAGFSGLVEMRGGYGGEPGEKGWEEAGLPTTREATAGGTWAELRKKK